MRAQWCGHTPCDWPMPQTRMSPEELDQALADIGKAHEEDAARVSPLTSQQLAEYRSADIGDWCHGPWTQDPVEGPEGESGHFLVKDRDGQVVAMVPHWAGSIALFIAVARDAVPHLLAEVDRLTAENDALIADLAVPGEGDQS